MFFYVNRWITDPEVDSRLSGHLLWPLVPDSHLHGVRVRLWSTRLRNFLGISGIILYSALWFDSGYMSVSVFEAGFAGDIAPRAVLSSLVGTPTMLGIMAGMARRTALRFFPCSDMFKAGIAGDNALCAVFARMRVHFLVHCA